MAFAFLTFSVFHENERFSTLQVAIIDLLAISTGDEVTNTLRYTAKQYGVLGYVIVYSYSALFFLLIQKMFVFLITSHYIKQVRKQDAVIAYETKMGIDRK